MEALGKFDVPSLCCLCERSTAPVTTTHTTTHPSTGHLSASHPSRPSPSSSHSNSSVTFMPQGVSMHPLLDASALTSAQSANQLQQQQMAAIQQQSQLHAMTMIQCLVPWSVPIHSPSYQAAPQNPQGQQLEPLGHMAQQPSTAQVVVMQPTPPHLTSLLGSSVVGETSGTFPTGPAVGGDGGAVDPPTQGAVHPPYPPFLRPLMWPHPTSQTNQPLLSCELSTAYSTISQQAMQ